MAVLTPSMGRLSLPAETSLFSLLDQSFTKITGIFNLHDPHAILKQPSALERILTSTFDTTAHAFVTEKSVRILAGLDDHDKSRLYLQAVAGMVLVLQRLRSARTLLSPGLFSRELQLFAESEQRAAVLDTIGSSRLSGACYTRNAIVDFVLAAVEERGVAHHDNLPRDSTGEDLLSDSVAWVSDRPCKKMGLPWGFTIMALN